MAKRKKQCVADNCRGAVLARGLCSACYQIARKMIRDGTVEDWNAIEKLGFATPQVAPGKKSAFRVAVTQKLSESE
jgi:hypothetical protein